jgi:hypothetical protein
VPVASVIDGVGTHPAADGMKQPDLGDLCTEIEPNYFTCSSWSASTEPSLRRLSYAVAAPVPGAAP